MKIRQIISGILVTLTILGLVVFLVIQRSKQSENGFAVPTLTMSKTTPVPTEVLTGLFQSPQSVDWQAGTITYSPDSAMAIVSKQTIDVNYYQKIAGLLHVAGQGSSSNDGGMFFGSDPKNYTSLTVYRDKQLISFSKNLFFVPTPNPPGTMDEQTLSSKSLSFLTSVIPLPSGMSYQKTGVSYLKSGNGDALPESSVTDADLVSFTYEWNYNGQSVVFPASWEIIITWRRDGTLTYVRAVVPPTEITTTQSVNLVTDDKLNTVLPLISSINSGFSSETANITLSRVTVTNAKMGYFYGPDKDLIQPTIIAQGNGVLPSGPVTVTLFFPIAK